MECNRIKVSIIVPIYNVEKYLDRCINSLLGQTLKEIEIILVDDGSPDNCPGMCDNYSQKYPQIKVVHKENGGLGYARNSGLEIASGEFVGFIDSDDFIDAKMYENLYLFAKENMLDTAFSAGFKFYDNGKIEEKPEVIEETLWEYDKICECFIPDIIGAPPTYYSDVKYAMSVCRGIYSLKQIRNNDIKFVSEREFLSEDILFNIEYLVKSKKIGMNPKCYYYYCCNEGSLTRSYRPDMRERMNKLYITIKERLQEEGIYYYADRNLDRLYLLMTRNLIASELFSNKNIVDRKIKLFNMYNDDILKQILNFYPYNQLPIRHKLFFILLNYRRFKFNNIIFRLILK